MKKKRNRFKQTTTLEERLSAEAMQLRAEAATLPPGTKRETLLRKARLDETAAHWFEWLNSQELRARTGTGSFG